MKKQTAIIILFLIGVYFPLFMHSDSMAIRLWDESLNAANALEMADNHQYMVRYFDGHPDMWHTKPPLLTWTQVISMNVVGFGVLGLRLPVAIAALLTVLALLWFGWRTLGHWKSGFFGGLVLVTLSGYVGNHVARTGDVDGLLVLFSTLFALAWFNYLHGPEERKNRYLIYAAIAMTFAILSKGIAVFLILPGLFLYTWHSKKLKSLLKNPRVYLAMGASLLLPLLYYLIREGQNPGYLQAVWDNELGGRFLSAIENHREPFLFYIENLWKGRFAYWVFLFLPLVLLGLRHPAENARRFIRFGLYFCLSYLFVISLSKTKLEWYDAPLFPIAALMMGIGLSSLWEMLRPSLKLNSPLTNYAGILLFGLAIFGAPYQAILKKVTSTQKQKWQPEKYGYIVYDWKKKKPNLKQYTLVYYGHPSIVLSYENLMERNPGYEIRVVHNREDSLRSGEVVLVCEVPSYEKIQADYEYQIVDSTWYGCKELRILGSR